jgi:hypothetical protein
MTFFWFAISTAVMSLKAILPSAPIGAQRTIWPPSQSGRQVNPAAKSIRPPSQSGRQVNLAGNKASIWHVAKS